MTRIITVLSLVALLCSCKMYGAGKEKHAAEEEAPVISSLKDAGLPCFHCHAYEKFSFDENGKFSHPKHLSFGVHCNQCHIVKPHREMLLNKDICNSCHKLTNFTYEVAGMPVMFSHQGHAKRTGCSECHPKLFQMKKGTSNIVMEAMYKGNSCGRCHDGKRAFASTDCARCHKMTSFKKELSYASGSMSPAIFSHELHTSMFECKECHASTFKYKKGGSGMKMDDLYQGKYCSKCHDGEKAFGSGECNKCHK